MRKYVLLFVVFLVTMPALAGDIVTDSIKSEILGATVKYNVYLPEDYDEKNSLYPVIYLLHGLWGEYTDWDEKGNMDYVADELIESGEIKDVVIIMPNAGGFDANTQWSGYFNMPGWSYEDFFFKELMPQAEKKYRVIGDKGHRAIMGLSMGGGGSVGYCQHHPELFSSCYAMSAWLDEDMSESILTNESKLYYTKMSVQENSSLKFLDNASEDVIKELRTVKWYFDCGDDDSLLELSFKMHMKMQDNDIPDQLIVRNGEHNWEYWHLALRIALPFASRNFY